MYRSKLCLIAGLLVGCCAAALGAAPGDNIALGRPYKLKPRGNYRLCTDQDDRVQLTDGVHTKGYFWTQKTTIGWGRGMPAIITIDLGEAQPIAGVSYNTAAGRAGVRWPSSVLVLVSEDGKAYYRVDDLIALNAQRQGPQPPPFGTYTTYRFWTDKLTTYGRYVQLVVVPDGPYTFVDEVEVHRGTDDLLGRPRATEPIHDTMRFFKEMEFAKCVRRRLTDDLAAVRKTVQATAATPGRAAALAELDRVETAIPKMPIELRDDSTTVLPLNDLHERIFAAQTHAWSERFSEPLVAWQKNRWDMLSPTEPPRPGGASLEVHMMRGECRSAAFNLSNTAKSSAQLTLRMEGLPGGPDPKWLTVHDARFTDTKSGVPIAAALPVAEPRGGGRGIDVHPGMTRHVWLTVNSDDLPAGDHRGAIRIAPGDVRIPLRVRVYPIQFPEQPTLHLGGWDYTDRERGRDVTEHNRDALIAHLRERFVDTPWATSWVLQRGKYDATGNMTEPPSDEPFKQWIARWPGARNYYVFAALSPNFGAFELGTPEFERAVGQWIDFWGARIQQLGLKPSQLALLLVDETHSHEQDDTIIAYAKIIHKHQPGVLVWEDPTWREPWKARPEMFEVSDILCPNLPMWIEEGQPFAHFYTKQRDAGRTLWFYSCSGPGKLLDPYAYHRMQHWFCWKYRAEGSCFWAFGDASGASCWNEYLSARGAFTPVFLSPTSVTAGKHMEAIREGMEDYEYLRVLRDRLDEHRRAGRALPPGFDAAQELLRTAADRVTGCMTERDKINWPEPKDRSIADQVRVEILQMLLKL